MHDCAGEALTGARADGRAISIDEHHANILMRMFNRPQGALGRVGGIIMARTNAACGAWITELPEIGPDQSVLEVGFGPGAVIQRLSKLAGHVAGIDPSQGDGRSSPITDRERYRESARIDLRRGSAERLQFDNDAFDKAVVIKRWRSTRCKSGRMPWPGCEKFGGSQDPAAGSPSVLLRIRGSGAKA
ncbi:MAG TPA: class I SAM-dependent methyltransferase [Pseudomonadota bacterium]|nr:class I SAM-dependent methyltransferase [Pseudomonadota bacterium]